MTKLTLEQQELLFANDCKLINLRYEYHGYTGTEKWAIVTELAEEELWVKYPDVIRRYTPFILLSMAQGEVITEYQNYEARERMRRLLFGHAFDINDGEFEVHHPELAVDTDPIEEIMLKDNIKRLREVLCYLSETQKRRVFKYFFYNKTLEKIADEEGVDFTSNPDMNYLRIIESEDLHMKEKEFKNVRWGDIYYCDLGVTNGSVQSGMRPVLVVQTNRLNESSPTVVVAAITAVKKKTAMNTHIELNTDCGLKEPSMVMLEQLRTVDKATELDNFVGRITDADKISEIKRGLKFAVGIPVKPKTERKGIVLSLCPRCRSEFQSIPENIVKRLDPFQADKEMCDKCQVGYGYDYMIFKKNHHHAKGGVDNV